MAYALNHVYRKIKSPPTPRSYGGSDLSHFWGIAHLFVKDQVPIINTTILPIEP